MDAVSGGRTERPLVVEVTRQGFGGGPEKVVFTSTFGILCETLGDFQDLDGATGEKLMTLARGADMLAAAL